MTKRMATIRSMTFMFTLLLSFSIGAHAAETDSTAKAQVKKTAKKASKKAAAKQTAAVSDAKTSPAPAKQNLSRDVRFNGSQVDGKYLSAGESVAEVEGDKDMGALIGIRKNFHDRLGDETARLEASTGKSATAGKGN